MWDRHADHLLQHNINSDQVTTSEENQRDYTPLLPHNCDPKQKLTSPQQTPVVQQHQTVKVVPIKLSPVRLPCQQHQKVKIVPIKLSPVRLPCQQHQKVKIVPIKLSPVRPPCQQHQPRINQNRFTCQHKIWQSCSTSTVVD